ncbi:hypothetical protein HQ544_00275 [Candidatus Falkowbacteria bacterium]|nr:hypothetical protein [Candidatus Falkowbacteria bacterium]
MDRDDDAILEELAESMNAPVQALIDIMLTPPRVGVRLPAYFLDGKWTELEPGEEIPVEVTARILRNYWERGESAFISGPTIPTLMAGVGDLHKIVGLCEEEGTVTLRNLNMKDAGEIVVQISDVGGVDAVYYP